MEVIEVTEVVEAVKVIEVAEVLLRPGKSLLRTSGSSRFLNSALLCFLKKNVGKIINITLNFSTFSIRSC